MKRTEDFLKRGKFKNVPSFQDTINKFRKKRLSKYPLRFLGKGYKSVYMMEEERDGNMHIVGTSGHGKSKYLEYHIRKDIDMSLNASKEKRFGLCLIDPSDRAATFHAVLEYCASINHPRVCIINPGTLYDYGKIACIKALDSKAPTKSAQAIQDAINILFQSSIINTPNIQDNLKALMRMLAKQDFSLYESTYFTEYTKEKDKWQWILSQCKGADKDIINDKFKTEGSWHKEFSTTIKRLNEFKSEPLSLMIGSNVGIDFDTMIDEGWVILCNLYPTHINWETAEFLGILIIAQLNRAIENLNEREEGFGVHGRKFYLYIDEAGRFATPQIENILSYNRKSGFNVILAHHFPGQIKNQMVMDAIRLNTTIKLMFHMQDPKDRLDMLKLMGFDNPQEALQKYKNLPKRHFVIKKGKEDPIEIVSPQVDPPVFKGNKFEIVERYIRERLQDPWYFIKGDIETQIKERIKAVDNDNESARTNLVLSPKRAVSDSKTDSGTPKTRSKSLFDFGADAEEYIRNKSVAKGDGSEQGNQS